MVLKLLRVDDWVTFRANKMFANVIRLGIKPDSYRKFDKTTNQWYVHKTQVHALMGFAKKFYTDIDSSDVPEKWLTKQSDVSNSSYDKLYLTSKAPLEVVKASYEALVLLYHPDHNDGDGDSPRLQEVIAAYRDICKVLKS